MNPRYLNASYYLMSGHEQVFWGFLDDIYHFHNGKISPYDKRYKNKKKRSGSRQFNDSRCDVSFKADPEYKQISNKTKKMDLRATPSKRSTARQQSCARDNDAISRDKGVTFNSQNLVEPKFQP